MNRTHSSPETLNCNPQPYSVASWCHDNPTKSASDIRRIVNTRNFLVMIFSMKNQPILLRMSTLNIFELCTSMKSQRGQRFYPWESRNDRMCTRTVPSEFRANVSIGPNFSNKNSSQKLKVSNNHSARIVHARSAQQT